VIENAQRKQRLEQLAFIIKVKKEEREVLKEERDGYQKLISQGVVGGLDLELQKMRDGLKPLRELLDKMKAKLEELCLEQQLDK
jgi:hypothetical protein